MGKPLASLLGAYDAQMNLWFYELEVGFSMSGTYQDINVPPTLISSLVLMVEKINTISPEFKKGNFIYYFITKLKKMDCHQIIKNLI